MTYRRAHDERKQPSHLREVRKGVAAGREDHQVGLYVSTYVGKYVSN